MRCGKLTTCHNKDQPINASECERIPGFASVSLGIDEEY